MSGQKTVHRYSRAFQIKVISEIESGKLTIAEARRIYDIGSVGTIHYWLKQHGKNNLLNKVVHVQMRDEKDKTKQLEKEKHFSASFWVIMKSRLFKILLKMQS